MSSARPSRPIIVKPTFSNVVGLNSKEEAQKRLDLGTQPNIMSSQTADGLHVVFIPFVAPGHMNPMVDMARLFAAHGVTSTVITTPCNALLYRSSVERDALLGRPIQLLTVELPGKQVGLPDGIENMANITTPEMSSTLHEALMLTRDGIQSLLLKTKPDCIVSDVFYPCVADVAFRLKIPRLAFHGGNFFHSCVEHCLRLYAPHEAVASDTEAFVVPGLPDKIELTKLQLPDWITAPGPLPEWVKHLAAAEKNCYGTLMNSFTQLEPDYEDFSKSSLGVKSWSIGPISQWPSSYCHKGCRGSVAAVEEAEQVSDWLSSRTHGSVVYVCFGTLMKIPAAQFREVAFGLESCGQPFVLVVHKNGGVDGEENLPDGFEERMKEAGKGYIIHGWAPQLLILEHPAVGGFVTHCGWNSILEGVCCGLPMATWPQSGEQFYNEKLVSDVLKTGVAVGASLWSNWTKKSSQEVISRDKISKAVTELMDISGESEGMRERARALANAAKKAVDSNGTSEMNLMSLIHELKSLKCKQK